MEKDDDFVDIREPWDDSLHGESHVVGLSSCRTNTCNNNTTMNLEEDEDEDDILLDIILEEEFLGEEGDLHQKHHHKQDDDDDTTTVAGDLEQQRHKERCSTRTHTHGIGLKKGFLLEETLTPGDDEQSTTSARVERDVQQQNKDIGKRNTPSCLKKQPAEEYTPRKPLSKFKQARMQASTTR